MARLARAASDVPAAQPLTREMLEDMERTHSETNRSSVWSATTTIASDGTAVMPLNSGTIGLANVRQERREAVAVLMQSQLQASEAKQRQEAPKYVDQPGWARRRDSAGSSGSLDHIAVGRNLSMRMKRRQSNIPAPDEQSEHSELSNFGEEEQHDEEEEDEDEVNDDELGDMGVHRNFSSRTDISSTSLFGSTTSSRRNSGMSVCRRRSDNSVGGASWKTDSWWSAPYGLAHPPQWDSMSEFSIPNTDEALLFPSAGYHRPLEQLMDVDEEQSVCAESEEEAEQGMPTRTPSDSAAVSPRSAAAVPAAEATPQQQALAPPPAPAPKPAQVLRTTPPSYAGVPSARLMPLGFFQPASVAGAMWSSSSRGAVAPGQSPHVSFGACSVADPPSPTSERHMSAEATDSTAAATTSPSAPPEEEDQEEEEPERAPTTLMIQHIPKSYSRDDLCELLDSKGLGQLYDFVYMPVKFATGMPFGYAFVNFVSEEAVQKCMDTLEGFNQWRDESDEVCSVSAKTTYQGQDACVQLYRNSPVMHNSVDDNAKPAIFKDGVRIPFPAPTKRIKPPRARAPTAASDGAEGAS